MSTIAPPEPLRIGPRVRALREAMDLSLRDLGDRAGVSAPMLSQVERGETSPTLAVAARIAGGLELSLSQLLRLDEADGVTVVRRAERRPGGARARGHSYEVLTPPLPGQRAEVSHHVLAPGAATGGPDDPPIHEDGDAVTFDADLPHHFENPGDREASFTAVVSAGLRRS
ncbi:MAG: helix-turn-helix domain-containing protein [Actinobacteria bacterium]|nr:MAG: helix-turn-helix domain-containing protein [Actinomycetota bacterium]